MRAREELAYLYAMVTGLEYMGFFPRRHSVAAACRVGGTIPWSIKPCLSRREEGERDGSELGQTAVVGVADGAAVPWKLEVTGRLRLAGARPTAGLVHDLGCERVACRIQVWGRTIHPQKDDINDGQNPSDRAR